MKRELRLLNIIAKKIDMSMFYVVSFRQGKIYLQGANNSEKLIFLRGLGYEPTLTDNNWIEMNKGCVSIVLFLN
jgi:hypothetical protein